jgi:hypothetical protein
MLLWHKKEQLCLWHGFTRIDSLPVTTNNQLGFQKGAKAGRAGNNLKI